MSRMDQAFIRAFDKQAGAGRQQALVRQHVESPKAPAHAEPSSAEPRSISALEQPAAPSTRTYRIDPPVRQGDSMPAPHVRFAPREAKVEAETKTVEERKSVVQREEGQQADAPIAAESEHGSRIDNGQVFTATIPLSSMLAKDAEPQLLEPAWQVDALGWPSEVERLVAAAEGCEPLLQNLLRLGHDHQRLVALTGPNRLTGCSLLALALAKSAKACGVRIALVDGDVESPSLAASLQLEPVVDWSALLDGGVPLTEVLVESISDQVTVMPLSKPPADSSLLVGNTRLDAALVQLRQNYDLVLLDAGPIGRDGAAWRFTSPLSWARPDAVLLVCDVREGIAERETAIRSLVAAGVNVWGVAENFAA